MSREDRRVLVASALSGCVWGAIAWLLARGPMGPVAWGGILASPLIGIVIGRLGLPARRARPWVRALLALATLYAAVVLFGVAAGIGDALRPIQGRDSLEVVAQAVLGCLWGVTFTGYFLVLWPLAVWNHGLVARLAPGN